MAEKMGGAACPTCGTRGSEGIGRDGSPRKSGANMTPLSTDPEHVKRREQARKLRRKNGGR